jgi:hypothetical protein
MASGSDNDHDPVVRPTPAPRAEAVDDGPDLELGATYANAPYVEPDGSGDQRSEERAREQTVAARGRKRPRRGRAHTAGSDRRDTPGPVGPEDAGMGPELPEFPRDSQVLNDEG